jgi:signal transduction histidine kinase
VTAVIRRGFAWQRLLQGLLVGAAGIAAITAVIFGLEPGVPVSALAGLYVLPVLPVAAGWGLSPALIVAVGSALAFDFFFFPPLFALTPSDAHIEAILVISGMTAVVVSGLSGRVRRRAGEAESLAREVQRVAEEQAALRRVATLVARAALPEQVFAAVTTEVGRLLSADVTLMSRYDPDGGATVVGAWSSAGDAGATPVGTRVQLGGRNVHTAVLRTRGPARVDHAEASGPAADVFRVLGIRSAVGVPISVEGRLWGAMIVLSIREEFLPADTEARLAGFTELVATALANAEAQAALTESRARIVAAADTTRRRIERDLHDGAQQRLVSLALELRAMRAAMPPEAGELTEQLDGVADGLTGVLDELREIARGLHPAALAEGGLRSALKTLARRSAVPVRLDVGVEGRLPEPTELAAYYVVSEALTNTAKHASATVIHVRVQAGGGVLQVRVSDDGRGGADLVRGTGLVGLTDRVEALGGRLVLESPPGAGTTMHVTLPLTAPGSPVPATGRVDDARRDPAAQPEPSGPARGS